MRCVRGHGLRGLVTIVQGLEVKPIRHSRIANEKIAESRQSSRLTVEGDTFRSRLSRHSAMSAPVMAKIGFLKTSSFRIIASIRLCSHLAPRLRFQTSLA